MTAATLNLFCAKASSKVFWIRANRVLAWTMVVSPALQWAAGMRFWTGFWIDIGILVAHAVLSFALFGKPETKSKTFSFGMHVMGFRSEALSPRNRFLLTGYRIALGASAIAALVYSGNPLVIIAVTILFWYPILRLAVSIGQHLHQACVGAMRRMRLSEGNVSAFADTVTFAYFVVSMFNMMRG